MSGDPRYILSIDSAVNGCGVCVYNVKDPEQSITTILAMSRGQAEALVPTVRDTVKKAGITFQDIDLIATTIGPGTFTGLRVGLSTAKSFALALDIPVRGFSTLEVIAEAYYAENKIDKKLCLLLESKRGDYYCQIWDAYNKIFLEASALRYDEILSVLDGADTVFIGDALERFQAEAGNQSIAQYVGGYELPDPFVLAEMVMSYKRYGAEILPNIEPLYLRGADVSKPKEPPRKMGA